MNAFIEIVRVILVAFAALFGLGWIALFLLLLRRVVEVFFARSNLHSIVLDPKLLFLRRFLIRVWCGALITGLLLVVLTLIHEAFIPK